MGGGGGLKDGFESFRDERRREPIFEGGRRGMEEVEGWGDDNDCGRGDFGGRGEDEDELEDDKELSDELSPSSPSPPPPIKSRASAMSEANREKGLG